MESNPKPKSPTHNTTILKPIAEMHYYFENGFMVFTEQYHIDRGYCCGSGCRHCPYTNKK